MVAALSSAEPWPASIVLAGEYGLEGVALSVPMTLSGDVLEWELSAEQRAGLRAGADVVRAALADLA